MQNHRESGKHLLSPRRSVVYYMSTCLLHVHERETYSGSIASLPFWFPELTLVALASLVDGFPWLCFGALPIWPPPPGDSHSGCIVLLGRALSHLLPGDDCLVGDGAAGGTHRGSSGLLGGRTEEVTHIGPNSACDQGGLPPLLVTPFLCHFFTSVQSL